MMSARQETPPDLAQAHLGANPMGKRKISREPTAIIPINLRSVRIRTMSNFVASLREIPDAALKLERSASTLVSGHEVSPWTARRGLTFGSTARPGGVDEVG